MRYKTMVLAVLLGCAAVSARAEDYPTYAGKKLGRGLTNAAFGWSEVFRSEENAFDRHGLGAALIWGPLDGIGNAVKRTGAGIWETATFPIQTSKDAEPIVEPEWPLQTDRAGERPKNYSF